MSQVKLLKILNGLPKEMDSALDQITLNSFSVFGGPVLSGTGLDLSNLKISNLADGIDSGDAINKGQLDLAVTPLTQYMESDIDRNSYRKFHVFENNAQVYADSSAAPVEDPSAAKRDGWYFKNASLGQKFNYYFYDPATQPEVTLGDTSLFAVMTFDAPGQSPILAVYTRPTGTNDIIPGFAHSRRVYSGMTPAPVVGQKYLVYFGQEPTVFPELPRIQLALSTGSTLGDQDDSQLIMTASIGSNSSSAAESVQFMMETLGFNSPNFKYTVDLRIRRASQKDLDALSSSLSQEAADRAAGDAALAADLAQEVSDRAAGDAAVQAAVDAVAADLAQAILDSGNDNSGLQAALDQEIADRAAGDSALQSAIDTEKDRIDAILNASEADKDSFAEIVQLINSVDTENDSAFAAYVLSNDAALAQEVSDRAAADSALQAAIDAEEARALAAEAALQAEVDAEEARALAAEAAIAADLAQEVADRTAADSALQAAIDAEEARALAAEAALQAEVDAEEARALAAEAAIAADLAQEAADRAAGDSALDVRVSALEALPEGDEIQFYDSEELFPEIGDVERIYIAKDVNKVFRFESSTSISEGSAEWLVGNAGNFATIQEALDSPLVLDGHKIKVMPGIYTLSSPITVSKEVAIYSDDKSNVTIQTSNDIAFDIIANNVILKELTIKNTKTLSSLENESCIRVLGNNFKLLDSALEFNSRALNIYGSSFVVSNCTLTCTFYTSSFGYAQAALGLYGNDGNSFILDNYIYNSYNGIIIEKSTSIPKNVSGKLTIDNNIIGTTLNKVAYFMKQYNFNGPTGSFELYVTNNTVKEFGGFINLFPSVYSSNANNYSKVVIANNSTLGDHGGTERGNKGFFAADNPSHGTSANSAGSFRGNRLPIYMSGNTSVTTKPRTTYGWVRSSQSPASTVPDWWLSHHHSWYNPGFTVSTVIPASPETPDLTISESSVTTTVQEYIQLGITESELNSAVSVVQTALDQEIADRAAGDSALQAEVDAEEARALAAEAALQAEVDAEEARALAAEAAIAADLAQEVADRTAADSALQAAIDAEEARALAAEAAIAADLAQEAADRAAGDSALQAEVDAEEARALAAEAVLAADLAQEAADRAAGDSALQSAIDAEKDRIDAILNASEADKDSFAEIVQLINSVDTENDNAFAAYVLSNDAALAQEVSDRIAGDAAVQAAVDAVAADLAQAILDSGNDNSGLQAALDQEIADRAAGDSALQAEIDAEEARALAAEAVLAADLAQEAADRAAGDSALQAEVDAEEARALAAEAALQAEIDAEEARALAAEAALQAEVDAEEARALAAEATIAADLAQEVSDRAAGDSALQSAIDAEEARALAAEATIAADLAQEVSDRAAGDSALDIRVSALEALPEGDEVQFYDSQELFPELGDVERVYIAKNTNEVFRFGEVQGEGLPEWTVGSGGDFATVQDALASENVLDTHKIKVLAGTYTVSSPIVVNKQVIIYSDDEASTIFTGSPVDGIFQVTADNVILSNLTIKHNLAYASHTTKFASAVAVMPNTSNFKLLDCFVEYNRHAVAIQSADYVIANSTFRSKNTSLSFDAAISSYGNQGTSYVLNNFFDIYNGDTRARSVAIEMTETSSLELLSGKLVVDGNSMYSSVDGRLGNAFIKFENGSRDISNPFELYVTNNYYSGLSGLVGLTNTVITNSTRKTADAISKIVMDQNSINGYVQPSENGWNTAYNRGFITESVDGSANISNFQVHFGTNTVRNFVEGPGMIQNPSGLFPSSYFTGTATETINVSNTVLASPETPDLSIPQTSSGSLEYIKLGITESQLNSAVSVVQTALDQEIADRAAGDSALQAEVDAEEARALAAEAALQAEIDAEEARALAAEAVLAADLAQEAADRAAADAALQAQIDALDTGYVTEEELSSAVSSLQAEVDAEEARALAAEAALQAAVDAEEARALAAEGALDTRVSALEAGKDEAKNLEREFTASVALAAKDVVFISGADSVGKAQADALSNAMAIGFAKESADANASVMVINEGVVAGFSGLTPGQIYYLDPSSPGAITSTIPSGSGQIVLQLGIAKNSTELLIQKQFMYVVA